MGCRRSYEDIWESTEEEEMEERRAEEPKRRNRELDYLWIMRHRDIIDQDMEIMKELLRWKGYSFSDFFDEKGHIYKSLINGWAKGLRDWAVKEEKMNEEEAKELGKLMRFCILYVCLVYKAERADILHVKKLLSMQEMNKDFFYELLMFPSDIPDRQALIEMYKSNLEGNKILEGAFVHRANKVLSEYIDTRPANNKVKSVHSWAEKMIEDCKLLTESGEKLFSV